VTCEANYAPDPIGTNGVWGSYTYCYEIIPAAGDPAVLSSKHHSLIANADPQAQGLIMYDTLLGRHGEEYRRSLEKLYGKVPYEHYNGLLANGNAELITRNQDAVRYFTMWGPSRSSR